jgi:hypothetical protein
VDTGAAEPRLATAHPPDVPLSTSALSTSALSDPALLDRTPADPTLPGGRTAGPARLVLDTRPPPAAGAVPDGPVPGQDTVQRQEATGPPPAPASAPAPAPDHPAAAPAAAAPADGGAGAAPDPEQLEELARRLVPSLVRRLKAEMLVDRERRGLRTDVR